MKSAEEIIAALEMKPLPLEGGYYRETYRSVEKLDGSGEKRLATAIYYLLTTDTASALHRLPSDEIWHFYLGDCVEMLLLAPDGTGKIALLGGGLEAGERPQILVPAGTWQGARVSTGGRFALMGTTVSPGFEFGDYDAGNPMALTELYPEFAERILALSAGARGSRRF